eukprot:1656384-Rhodomonas_salina.1
MQICSFSGMDDDMHNRMLHALRGAIGELVCVFKMLQVVGWDGRGLLQLHGNRNSSKVNPKFGVVTFSLQFVAVSHQSFRCRCKLTCGGVWDERRRGGSQRA